MPFTDLAQDIFHRYPDIVESHLPGGRAVQSHFLLFRTKTQAGHAALHQKSGEMHPVDLGKDREDICKSGIGDELFGAVEDVVRTVCREHRRRFRSEGIGTGIGFGQTIGADHLGAYESPQIPLLLIRTAVIDQRQHADPGMTHVGQTEIAGASHLFHDQHAGCLVECQAAELFRRIDHHQAQFGAVRKLLAKESEVLGLDCGVDRPDLAFDKSLGGFGDLFVFVGEILGGKYVPAGVFPYQEIAAGRDVGHVVCSGSVTREGIRSSR